MKRTLHTDVKKQKVFKLRERGLTYDQISAALKIPVPTVGSWVRLAIAKNPRKNKKLVYPPGPRYNKPS